MIEGIDLIVILIIILVLLFLGPTKFPELARGIGRAWSELRLARKETESTLVGNPTGSRPGTLAKEEVGK